MKTACVFLPLVIGISSVRAATDIRVNFTPNTTNADVAGDAADPDGEGVSNLLECTNGTDPLSAGVVP